MMRIVINRVFRKHLVLAQFENVRRAVGTASSYQFLNKLEIGSVAVTSKKWHSTSVPIENGPSYLMHSGSAPLLEKTVGQILDQTANRYPNRLGIVSCHENVRLTFAEIRARVDKFAAGLKKLGLQRGDRVAAWGPSTIDWYITFLAAARAGFSLVGINPADQPSEVEYCLRKVGVRAVIAAETFKTQNYAEMLRNARSKCPTLEHIIISTDKHLPGTRRFVDVASLANKIEIEAIAAEQSEISSHDAFSIQFTSGTTGRPKATKLAHRSIVNNSRQMVHRLELDVHQGTVCLNVPLFHAFGILGGSVGCLHAGATLVMPAPSFKANTSLDAIVKEKCTVVYGTPTMWVDLINLQQQIHAPIGNIRRGVTGGSPAGPELFKRIKNTLGVNNMGSIYGLTETTGIVFQSLPDDSEELVRTTVGHLSDHTEAQVVDENGNPVPFGTLGELLIRGYCTMIGYWDDEENTNKTLTKDGWIKTGDQFILQSNGYGNVVGRLKDMIIRGGENVFPREIEDFLQTHPAIVEAQVFGVADDRMGEEICACIRLRKGQSLTLDSIREFSRGKIAHYKIPRYLDFVDDFPKTTSGKIKKHVLRESVEVRNIVPAK